MEADHSNDVGIATKSGGTGAPDLFLVHATGFCKEVWDATISKMDHLPPTWRSMDLRGHGDSGAGPFPQRWDRFGGDVLRAMGDATNVLGVGHSCGGAALLRAELDRPGTFRHLVVIEPIIFPPPFQRLENPYSEGARRRRRVFRSRDAALDAFAGGPFGNWDFEVLTAYVDNAFVGTEEGWVLKCDPELEADVYAEGLGHDTWDRVSEITTPVTFVAGEESTSHREPFLSELVARFRHVELVVLPGVGHLVPMEQPGTMARIIDDALRV